MPTKAPGPLADDASPGMGKEGEEGRGKEEKAWDVGLAVSAEEYTLAERYPSLFVASDIHLFRISL